MRKICDSSNTECRKSLSRCALARSFPNGFSITTREFSARSASRSIPITRLGRLGRHRQVVQPAAPRPEQRLGLLDRCRETFRPRRLRHVGEPVGEDLPRRAVHRAGAEARDGPAGEVPELLRGQLVHRRADDPDVRGQGRLLQVGQARQQLAFRQVTGGPEQHDDVGRQPAPPTVPRGRTDTRWTGDVIRTCSLLSPRGAALPWIAPSRRSDPERPRGRHDRECPKSRRAG